MTPPKQFPVESECVAHMMRQRGLISREQAFRAGMTTSRIRNRLAGGAWVEVRRGVYGTAAVASTWQQSALAALMGRCPAVAVSHGSAAYLHRLVPVPPTPPEVIVPYSASTSGLSRVARPHRTRIPLEPLDVVQIEGLATTSLPRTILDLAASTPTRTFIELVDRAMRSQTSDVRRGWLVRQLHDRSTGVSGAASLRCALAPWFESGRGARGMQSMLEAQVLRVLLEAGLPAPEVQYEVVLPGGARVYLDFAWPAVRVALEVDGYAFHADRDSFDHDRARGNRLLATGWRVLHTTAKETYESPDTLVDAVRSMISAVERPAVRP
jgi:very-short-patch-repair endonuclease